jgi:hypothetical protein
MTAEMEKLTWGLANRAVPAPINDNVYGPVRVTRYGEMVTAPLVGAKLYPVSDEGSYFIATNATPGTAIAGIAAADGFDDLEALMFLRHSSSSSKRLYLDWILLQVAAAGTNGTNFGVAMKCDKGTSRFASGGTAITPKNANMASSTATEIDKLQFGAVVPTAATAEARLLWHTLLRTVIKVIGDKYLFMFGGSAPPAISGIPLEGTTQASLNYSCPPVILGPGDTFLLHEFATSQTVAAQYQFAMGWHER